MIWKVGGEICWLPASVETPGYVQDCKKLDACKSHCAQQCLSLKYLGFFTLGLALMFGLFLCLRWGHHFVLLIVEYSYSKKILDDLYCLYKFLNTTGILTLRLGGIRLCDAYWKWCTSNISSSSGHGSLIFAQR